MAFLWGACDNCQIYLSCNFPVIADNHNSEMISRDIQDRLFPAKNDPRVMVIDVTTGQPHTHLCRLLLHKDTGQAECPAQGCIHLSFREGCLFHLKPEWVSGPVQPQNESTLKSERFFKSRMALGTQGTIPERPNWIPMYRWQRGPILL